jgi:hypothetical protein
MTDETPRSAAGMAGICDEDRLLTDACAAFTRAGCFADLDATWRTYVAPVKSSIGEDTLEMLSRAYSLRLSTLAWSN